MYDPAIGRWNGVDLLSELDHRWTSYHYTYGNPLRYIDIGGYATAAPVSLPSIPQWEIDIFSNLQRQMDQANLFAPPSTIVEENSDGTFRVVGGNPNDGDNGIYVGSIYGRKIGKSITSHSFFGENNKARIGAIINLNSTEGQDFLDNEIIIPNIPIIPYMYRALPNMSLDFKVRGRENAQDLAAYKYRGSVARNGKIGSARDFGNIAAGIVAARLGLSWGVARLGFDGLEMVTKRRPLTIGGREVEKDFSFHF